MMKLIPVNFFLTSLKSLVNRLTLFTASHTSNYSSPFLFSFCSYVVVGDRKKAHWKNAHRKKAHRKKAHMYISAWEKSALGKKRTRKKAH